MAEMFFQGLPPVLGSHHIPFPELAVVSKKVYILPALVVLFHNANVFSQITTVLWKIVQAWLQKVRFDRHSCPELAETLFLFLFHTPRVSQEVWNYWLQWLTSRLSSFVQCFVKHWVFHEFSYLSIIKYTNVFMFIHGNFS